jgi:hypothetical protein
MEPPSGAECNQLLNRVSRAFSQCIKNVFLPNVNKYYVRQRNILRNILLATPIRFVRDCAA